MVPYHRPKSGHITCYLNRTYHVLLTGDESGPCRLGPAVLTWTYLRIVQGGFWKIRLAFQHEGRAPGGGGSLFLFLGRDRKR